MALQLCSRQGKEQRQANGQHTRSRAISEVILEKAEKALEIERQVGAVLRAIQLNGVELLSTPSV
jgi:hypothetical protein